MRQHITPKQAKSINKEDFYSLFDNLVDRKYWFQYHHAKMTIGKMIEILTLNVEGLSINIEDGVCRINPPDGNEIHSSAICDVLWYAIQLYIQGNWGKK